MTEKLRLLDTFAGIGGFSYAAEKLVGGFETVQFIEIDPYCQQVLNKNFPNIPIHDDITTYRAKPHSADIITGGFPCTDISQAGRREGITETSKSGLWFQLIRTIRMVRPKYFILENVSAILANGMDIVLGDIFEAGYDAEWCCIPSSFVGACHQRDRWWLIGFSSNSDSLQRFDVLRQQPKQRQETQQGTSDRNNRSRDVANSKSQFSNVTKLEHPINKKSSTSESRNSSVTTSNSKSKRTWKDESRLWRQSEGGDLQTNRDSNEKISNASNSESIGCGGRSGEGCSVQERDFLQGKQTRSEMGSKTERCSIDSSNPDSNRLQGKVGSRIHRATWKTQNIRRLNPNWRQYISQPTIRRGDDGLSNKLDASQRVQRLKQLGNSIVPQVAAIPLQRVIQLEREQQ